MIDLAQVMDNMLLGLSYSGLTPGAGWDQFHTHHIAVSPKRTVVEKKGMEAGHLGQVSTTLALWFCGLVFPALVLGP